MGLAPKNSWKACRLNDRNKLPWNCIRRQLGISIAPLRWRRIGITVCTAAIGILDKEISSRSGGGVQGSPHELREGNMIKIILQNFLRGAAEHIA